LRRFSPYRLRTYEFGITPPSPPILSRGTGCTPPVAPRLKLWPGSCSRAFFPSFGVPLKAFPHSFFFSSFRFSGLRVRSCVPHLRFLSFLQFWSSSPRLQLKLLFFQNHIPQKLPCYVRIRPLFSPCSYTPSAGDIFPFNGSP